MRTILGFLIALCLSLSCDRQPTVSDSILMPGSCLTVSYVTGICGEAVLKIENPAYHHLGETWNGIQNVFFTMLHCETNENDLKGNIFYVELLESSATGECFRCLATIGYSGSKRYHIKIKNNCLDSE